MAFDTKINLSDSKFEQAPSDVLTLSGTTNFSTVDGGDLLIDGVSIKSLTGSTSGNFWPLSGTAALLDNVVINAPDSYTLSMGGVYTYTAPNGLARDGSAFSNLNINANNAEFFFSETGGLRLIMTNPDAGNVKGTMFFEGSSNDLGDPFYGSGLFTFDRTMAQYAGDYSAFYSDRSLVDKGWVLSAMTSGGTGQVENGLSSDGGIVKLGGPLSEDTIIDLSGRTLFLGTDVGLQVLLDPSNNQVSITNDASVFAPTPLLDTYPTLTLNLYFDSGDNDIKVDAANVTDSLSIVGFTCDLSTLSGDDPNGLTYEGSMLGSISGDGTFTFYGTTLPNPITLVYVYNSLTPRSGDFFAIDNPTANAATQGSPFSLTSSPAGGFVGENIKQFIGSNYLGFPLDDQEIVSNLKFYSDGSIGVESSSGQGLKLESVYDNSTLHDNSYVPKSWAKERFDIITGTSAQVSNGLRLTDTGYIVLGGELTGNTEIVGLNNFGVRFKNVDHFGINIQSVGLNINNSPGFDQAPIKIIEAANNKFFIVGGFNSYSGITGYSGGIISDIIRINSDRSLDTTFKVDGTGFTNSTFLHYALEALQLSGGSIMVGGTFGGYNGNGCYNIVKLNSDGSEDTAWTANAGLGLTQSVNSYVNTMAEYTGNKLLVGGGVLSSWNGVPLPNGAGNNCLRLNGDGTIDTSFRTGSYAGGSGIAVMKIIVMPDNRIFTCGLFSTFSGVTCNGYVMRLSNGHIDPTFKLSGATSEFFTTSVYDAILLSTGNIALLGQFSQIGNVERSVIAVIDPNGDLVTSFNATGITEEMRNNPRVLLELSNQQLIFGYGGPAISGTTSNGWARLNPDGSTDLTFNAGGSGFPLVINGEFENWAYPLSAVAVGDEEDILVVGEFLTYNDNVAYNFTKVSSGGTLVVNDNPAFVVSRTTVEYSDKRHHLYNNRTLVDREYVDLKVAELVGDQYVNRGGYTGTTVGATPDNKSFIIIPTGQTASVEMTATASDGTDRALFRIQGLFYNISGSTQQEGATTSLITPIKSAGASAWDIEFDVQGNQLRLLVNGDTGQTVKWHFVYEVQTLHS